MALSRLFKRPAPPVAMEAAREDAEFPDVASLFDETGGKIAAIAKFQSLDARHEPLRGTTRGSDWETVTTATDNITLRRFRPEARRGMVVRLLSKGNVIYFNITDVEHNDSNTKTNLVCEKRLPRTGY